MRRAGSVEDPDGVGRRVRVKVASPGVGQAGSSDLQDSVAKNISEFWFSRRYTRRKRGKGNLFLVGSQRGKDRVDLMKWYSASLERPRLGSNASV